ncbi:MAG: methylated-DNA--[Desulfovibrio sp.]|nr:methylated-DNA--[protein]-cysteine S-methyltransferase [Desulfovibrio sp.]
MDYHTQYTSPLGQITLAANSSAQALIGLWFFGQKYYAAKLGPSLQNDNLPIFTTTKQWLDRYFCGEVLESHPTLELRGSAFSQAVLRGLLAIPYGQTMSYGAIAKALGRPNSARAVARVVAHNPISIIIPCHRVVGSQGQLTGYAGGLDKKLALLKLEGIHLDIESERCTTEMEVVPESF